MVAELKKRGLDIWYDQNALIPGSFWRDEIRRAIREHERFIACFSSEYTARSRTYMNEELSLAIGEIRERGSSIWFIPILLSGEVPDIEIHPGRTLRDIQHVSLAGADWDDGIERLARALLNMDSHGTTDGLSLEDESHSRSSTDAAGVSIKRLRLGQPFANRFRILERLRRGRSAENYRAFDVFREQEVKLDIRPDGAVDHEQLRSEVSIGQFIRHPNVSAAREALMVKDAVVVVTDYIPGFTLEDLISSGAIEQSIGLRYAEELMAGLAAIHEQGIVHRDIKPGNILIGDDSRLRITNFGMAIHSGANRSEIAGTPVYMAPEQLLGAMPSVASDIFSSGLVLFEMFTGKRMVEGHTFKQLFSAHETILTRRPSSILADFDAELEHVIMSCLVKQPLQRPSALDLRHMLVLINT